MLNGSLFCSYVPKGALPDLHHCAYLLGMFLAVLDLAASGSVPPLTVPLHQSKTQHQLSDNMSNILQQLHQSFPLYTAHKKLQGVPEEAQAVLDSWQVL